MPLLFVDLCNVIPPPPSSKRDLYLELINKGDRDAGRLSETARTRDARRKAWIRGWRTYNLIIEKGVRRQSSLFAALSHPLSFLLSSREQKDVRQKADKWETRGENETEERCLTRARKSKSERRGGWRATAVGYKSKLGWTATYYCSVSIAYTCLLLPLLLLLNTERVCLFSSDNPRSHPFAKLDCCQWKIVSSRLLRRLGVILRLSIENSTTWKSESFIFIHCRG